MSDNVLFPTLLQAFAFALHARSNSLRYGVKQPMKHWAGYSHSYRCRQAVFFCVSFTAVHTYWLSLVLRPFQWKIELCEICLQERWWNATGWYSALQTLVREAKRQIWKYEGNSLYKEPWKKWMNKKIEHAYYVGIVHKTVVGSSNWEAFHNNMDKMWQLKRVASLLCFTV